MSITKPFPIQKADILFGAEPLYRLLDELLSEGVVGAGDFAVSERAGGANLSVDVAAGDAIVALDSVSGGGKRWVRNTGTSNSGTPGAANSPDWLTTFLSPDPTNPRVDRVVLKIRDGNLDATGAYDSVLQVIAGTPTAGATLGNLNGAAAVPANCVLLANVLVEANDTTITSAQIDTSVRSRATIGAGVALAVGGQLDYAETTSDVTVSATTAATANTVVTGSAITLDGNTPIWVELWCRNAETGVSAGSELVVELYDGSTDLGEVARVGVGDGTRAAKQPVIAKVRLTPSAGSHTYSFRAWRVTANGTIRAADAAPAYIRVTRA